MPRVQQKRGTDANLTSVDPTPLAGELIVVSDENSLKIGNGVDSYTSLAYATATPRSHKSTHATGGSDALSPSDIGAAPAASPTFSGTVTARNDASANTYPLTVANGQNWAWGVGINFAQPATSGGAITDTARLVSDFDSTGNFSFRFHTMGGGTLAERMRITGAGRLAINAASDTVNHMIVARGSSTGDGAILLKSSSTGTAANDGFLLQCFGANSDAYVWQYENSPLIFGTNSTERMRLTAGGDLAIGRTSAASALDVNGVITVSAGSAAAPALCASGDVNTGLAFPAADTAIISTGGVERVRVGSDGLSTFTFSLADAISGGVNGMLTGSKFVVYNKSDSATHAAIALRARASDAAVANIGIGYGTDASDGYLYFRIRDSGTTNRLVTVMKANGAVRFVPLAADPASGEAGDVYYNSTDNKLRVYNGTSWVDLH